MGELRSLPNIAEKLEGQLNDVGITTPEELAAIGSKEAWLRILARDPSAWISRLYALEGALRGIHRFDLDAHTKADLKPFYNTAKEKK